MKIIVSIKQVPVRDSQLRIDANGRWIQENDLSFEINEPDAYALEEALQLKEKHGGEVIALCAGPARASQTIREALAKGADRAIHLEDNAFVGYDALNTAKVFAAAIKDEQFDLIFTGLQSDDYGYAQTGVILAELLGCPHATIIMQLEKTDVGIRVKRELEAGYFQFVDMPLPAVLTIQSGINKLRYATLIGIKQAKNKPLRKVALAEVQSAIGALGQGFAQHLLGACRATGDDDYFTLMLFPLTQRLFERVGVGLVDFVGNVFTDPVAGFVELEWRIFLRHLFHADKNFQMMTPFL